MDQVARSTVQREQGEGREGQGLRCRVGWLERPSVIMKLIATPINQVPKDLAQSLRLAWGEKKIERKSTPEGLPEKCLKFGNEIHSDNSFCSKVICDHAVCIVI